LPVAGAAPDGIRKKQFPSRAYGVDLLPDLESMGCPVAPPLTKKCNYPPGSPIIP
jgi:hypothetical protein